MKNEFLRPEKDKDLTAAEYYNQFQIEHAILMANFICEWKSRLKYYLNDNNKFIFNDDARGKIEAGKEYSPIAILAKAKFNNSLHGAQEWVLMTLQDQRERYIRVGTNYFKIARKNTKAEKNHDYLKAWDKGTIITQFGPRFLDSIPIYTDFTLLPSHIKYQQTIGDYYNLYQPLSYRPKVGNWEVTKEFLEHIFGEQYDLGIEYLQNIYVNPTQILPVLCLVSEERQTGKTTFLNWVEMIFGANASMLTHENIESNFNSDYIASILLLIDEMASNKMDLVERIKTLATAKTVTRSEKHIANSKIPFYGKVILNSNRADSFLKIDNDEIRFWVRQLTKPKNWKNKLEDEMRQEIPAFLYYLTTLELKAARSRMVFTPQEISTHQLKLVVEGSKSELYKEIYEYLKGWFMEKGEESLYATPTDLKKEFFPSNNKFTVGWIKKCLNKEFEMTPEKQQRYPKIWGGNGNGTPYLFKSVNFV